MRRSRRSLGLLLGMMATWLAVVRATTQPALEAETTSRNVATAKATSSVAPRAATKLAARDLPARPFVAPAEATSRADESVARRSSGPVSAIAVIVVIPDAGVSFLPRFGWSGCQAYAVGCDHLGRSLTDAKVDPIMSALSARRF